MVAVQNTPTNTIRTTIPAPAPEAQRSLGSEGISHAITQDRSVRQEYVYVAGPRGRIQTMHIEQLESQVARSFNPRVRQFAAQEGYPPGWAQKLAETIVSEAQRQHGASTRPLTALELNRAGHAVWRRMQQEPYESIVGAASASPHITMRATAGVAAAPPINPAGPRPAPQPSPASPTASPAADGRPATVTSALMNTGKAMAADLAGIPLSAGVGPLAAGAILTGGRMVAEAAATAMASRAQAPSQSAQAKPEEKLAEELKNKMTALEQQQKEFQKDRVEGFESRVRGAAYNVEQTKKELSETGRIMGWLTGSREGLEMTLKADERALAAIAEHYQRAKQAAEEAQRAADQAKKMMAEAEKLPGEARMKKLGEAAAAFNKASEALGGDTRVDYAAAQALYGAARDKFERVDGNFEPLIKVGEAVSEAVTSEAAFDAVTFGMGQRLQKDLQQSGNFWRPVRPHEK